MSYQSIYTTTSTGMNTSGILHVHAANPNAARPWEVHGYYPNSPPPAPHSALIPLPPVSGHPTLLHPILEWVPNPTIMYTLYEHPSTATPDRRRANPTWKDEAATHPALSHITIRIPNFDRPVVVKSYSAVTVLNILTAVHEELRNEAYHTLCRSARGPWANPAYVHAIQVEEDIQRVVTQILGGRVMWDGLTPSKTERDVWVLHVR